MQGEYGGAYSGNTVGNTTPGIIKKYFGEYSREYSGIAMNPGNPPTLVLGVPGVFPYPLAFPLNFCFVFILPFCE